ncbi:MAG: hypothetical protein AB8D78_01115 [Akkermansiaceae bacterium]
MSSELQDLLKKRLKVIADHEFRDRDPSRHLNALQKVSEELENFTKTHQSEFDPKLRHYLTNSSFQKALDHISK